MTRQSIWSILIAAVLSLLLAAPAAAADMKELQQRFKERHGKLQELKRAGTIGEASDGYVAFVKGEEKEAAKIVNAENADRRELYKLLAEEARTTPETVAKRNAQRNFKLARAGEWLREDGKWRQKE